jgi:hypothetical protein
MQPLERKSKTWTLQSKDKKLPKTWYKALFQYHAATAAARPKWTEDVKYLSLDAHSISMVRFVIIISLDHVIVLSLFKGE